MGEVECEECGEELGEGDSVFVCGECDEVLCENCKEEHECIEEPDEETYEECSVCGDITSAMYLFEDVYFCENCIEEAKKNKIEEIREEMKEYDYENYVKGEVIKGLK